MRSGRDVYIDPEGSAYSTVAESESEEMHVMAVLKRVILVRVRKKSVNNHKVFYDTMKNQGGPLIIAKRERKPVHRVQMTDGKRAIIRQLLQEYDIQDAKDIQDALKDLLGRTIKEMMEAEMDHHLGYEKSERTDSTDEVRDCRNGYKTKQVNYSFGSMDIEVSQDRLSEFETQVVKKRQKDISDIDRKIISMYAKGLSTKQIS